MSRDVFILILRAFIDCDDEANANLFLQILTTIHLDEVTHVSVSGVGPKRHYLSLTLF